MVLELLLLLQPGLTLGGQPTTLRAPSIPVHIGITQIHNTSMTTSQSQTSPHTAHWRLEKAGLVVPRTHAEYSRKNVLRSTQLFLWILSAGRRGWLR